MSALVARGWRAWAWASAVSFAAPVLATMGCGGDGPPPPPTPRETVSTAQGAVIVAGTGAMTLLSTRLAEAWAARGGRPGVVVEPSLGSGGAIKAVHDGAIDLGMVSRPLTSAERALGLEVVSIARSAVVMAAHPSVAPRSLSLEQLEALHAGTLTELADGRPVTLLLRDREESANAALDRWVPSLAALRARAYATRRFRVLYHDDAMIEALASTPGAVGVTDLVAIVERGARVNVLALGGVEPSARALLDGSYRAARDLAFVHRPERAERVRQFVGFVRSPEGSALIVRLGAVPLATGAAP